MTIERYLSVKMGVEVEDKQKPLRCLRQRVRLPKIQRVLDQVMAQGCKVAVHIMSCHRDPLAILGFVEEGFGADVVVGVGSKALACPA